MEKKLEIILIEDDELACRDLSEATQARSDEFVLLASTNNTDAGLELVMQYKPDVVVLDIEFHNGKGSGLDFLYNLKSVVLDKLPFILIATNNISKVIHNSARTLGADYIITKTQHDYSANTILNTLDILKPTLLKKTYPQYIPTQIAESVQQRNKRLRTKISNEIIDLGINPKDVGYKYLVEAILLTMKGTSMHLCQEVANIYKKTEPSVERAMSNAINRTWLCGDYDHLLEKYKARIKSDRGVPTITEFVYYYADKFNNEY